MINVDEISDCYIATCKKSDRYEVFAPYLNEKIHPFISSMPASHKKFPRKNLSARNKEFPTPKLPFKSSILRDPKLRVSEYPGKCDNSHDP